MNFDQFIAKYNGKGIDFDGVYGNQCMDLMNQYVQEVLGIPGHPLGAPTAYQSFVNAKTNDNFEKIDNTPSGVPQKGDIMYWNTSIGAAGHVAVFIDGNTSTFRSFDQNWPTGSICHIQSHNYNGVAGWLRPKKGTNMATISDAEYEDLKKWKAAGELLTKERDTVLYPFVTGVTGALGIPNKGDLQPALDAINNLKGGAVTELAPGIYKVK